MVAASATIERRRILVQGIVQGVGFRPFVYGQALRHGLAGFVLNDSAGVTIEVEGTPESVERFQRALRDEAPPLARIDAVSATGVRPLGETAFVIAHSHAGAARRTLIAPDTATCDDCLRELFDPSDRRYRYPFINCTNCGPRFTIVQDVPYDRDKTTMRVFPMCADCQREYEDPLNRRFHAQPNACPVCGPSVTFERWPSPIEDGGWKMEDGGIAILDPPSSILNSALLYGNSITTAAHALAAGAILAIKGLGGYHLACDALDASAVARLRQRKRREAKPLALMAPDLATVRQLCRVSDAEAELLESRQRPIVLLDQQPDCPVAPGVAPGYTTLGIMLPYTPMHHLLLHDFAAAVGPGHPAVLVMTSGNLSDEPIAYRDADARARLSLIAEGILAHNRDIHMRCDDSIARVVAGGVQFLRRSRGYAPAPLPVDWEFAPAALACGGHLKNTFCLGQGRQAFVGHHIGDLENLETLTSFREGIEHFKRLFDCAPAVVAYDLHPEYLATKEAFAIAESPAPSQLIGVQHHHAHIASVLAEHGLSGPVIGVAADGTGYGTDGAIWGCEVLIADMCDFERFAQLSYIPLPGGEQAVRQPWRVAAAYMVRAYGDAFLDMDLPFVRRIDRARWQVLAQMIARDVNSPPASSLGRLFDAVAALVGLRDEVQYEGQAAIELEQIADEVDLAYPFTITVGRPAQIDVTALIRAIADDLARQTPPAQIAGRFHRTVAEFLAAACVEARDLTGLNMVALSGGVFQNRLLLTQLIERLDALGFVSYINRRVPPNDGGLSLGQIAVAAARVRNAA